MLVTKGFASIRTMDCFVAACGPAVTILQTRTVIFTADDDVTGATAAEALRVLQMALHAQVGIALGEHFLVHGAMGIMTSDASFAHSLVIEDEGTLLLGMALGAGLILGLEAGGAAALDRIALVDIMAIGAGHLAIHHLMGIGKAELAALLKMALEASLGRFTGVDNVFTVAGLHMEAGWTVARLAGRDLLTIRGDKAETSMRSMSERGRLLLVAGSTFLSANEGGTWNDCGRGLSRTAL